MKNLAIVLFLINCLYTGTFSCQSKQKGIQYQRSQLQNNNPNNLYLNYDYETYDDHYVKSEENEKLNKIEEKGESSVPLPVALPPEEKTTPVLHPKEKQYRQLRNNNLNKLHSNYDHKTNDDYYVEYEENKKLNETEEKEESSVTLSVTLPFEEKTPRYPRMLLRNNNPNKLYSNYEYETYDYYVESEENEKLNKIEEKGESSVPLPVGLPPEEKTPVLHPKKKQYRQLQNNNLNKLHSNYDHKTYDDYYVEYEENEKLNETEEKEKSSVALPFAKKTSQYRRMLLRNNNPNKLYSNYDYETYGDYYGSEENKKLDETEMKMESSASLPIPAYLQSKEEAPQHAISLQTFLNSLQPISKRLINFVKQSLMYLLHFTLTGAICGTLTLLICTFSPICDMSFSGLNQVGVKKQIQEVMRTYVTPENLNYVTNIFKTAMETYSALD